MVGLSAAPVLTIAGDGSHPPILPRCFVHVPPQNSRSRVQQTSLESGVMSEKPGEALGQVILPSHFPVADAVVDQADEEIIGDGGHGPSCPAVSAWVPWSVPRSSCTYRDRGPHSRGPPRWSAHHARFFSVVIGVGLGHRCCGTLVPTAAGPSPTLNGLRASRCPAFSTRARGPVSRVYFSANYTLA